MIIIDMKNKTVIVTGAASGIGQASASILYENGYHIIAIDKNMIGPPFESYICDISSEDAVKELFDIIKKNHNNLTGLVNCAGIYCLENREGIENIDINGFEKMIKTNLSNYLIMMKNSVSMMKEGVDNKFIINISSDQAFYPRIKDVSYAISKSGINAATIIAAKEFAKYNIRVNGLAPASVKTGFLNSLSISADEIDLIYGKEKELYPFGMIQPRDIAEYVLFLASDKAIHISGQILLIDSGKYL